MRTRLLAILLLALLLNVILTTFPSAIQSQPPIVLVCLLPPQRLELPAGQGIEVQCRLQGERQAASVVFRVDGVPLRAEEVLANGSVTFAWRPTQTGPHTLTITAGAGGHEVTTVARQVLVTLAGSPVRIP